MFSRTPEKGRWRLAAVLSSMAVLAGCADTAAPELADYLTELDVETPIEQHAEVPLGSYAIPIAIESKAGRTHWRLFQFQLYAVTSLEDQQAVEEAWDEHQGELQDKVIAICRSMSLDELEDQQLSTIKSRLVDAARPLLGTDRVRRLFIVDAIVEAI